MTFRLREGADEASLLVADKRLQTDFAYQQPGLLRRTTARADDGEWIVVDVWGSNEEADACAQRWDADPVVAEFMRHVDPLTVRTRRYEHLD